MLQVKAAECHDLTCLDVTGPGDHTANVNPVGFVAKETWRVDCDDCFTCVSTHPTKGEALDAALRHVSEPPRRD